jgi:hypothetical protein
MVVERGGCGGGAREYDVDVDVEVELMDGSI